MADRFDETGLIVNIRPSVLMAPAGDFAGLGSTANLIVVQRASASGVTIGFWDRFKIGAPLPLATQLIGTRWLWL